MRNIIYPCLLIFLFSIFSDSEICAQKKYGVYSIAFYNVENLFDTEDDSLTFDEDFTPGGANSWTVEKYQKKLNNLASVINKLAREHCPVGPAVIGVSEVENRQVLEDLVKTKEIVDMGYQIVHQDSPDRRGIDVALLYNPTLFKLKDYKTYPYKMLTKPGYKTRDVLLVNGYIDGEELHILVNHWPSRYGSKSSELREYAASICKHIVDSLYSVDNAAKVIIMGDMNDDPTNKSCRVVLNAKKEQRNVRPQGLFNTVWSYYERGIGTLCYKNQWNLFDQIIISYDLLGKDRSSLKFWKTEIFNRDFLINKEGKNKGYPHRTFAGSTFINGYSDHLPVILYLVKEIHR